MSNVISLNANPNQVVSIVVQTLNGYGDGYGNRVDGYIPQISSVYMPSSQGIILAQGFPMAMTRLETGLYYHNIQIPVGSTSIGTFIVSTFHLENTNPVWNTFLINVARPFGNSSASPI